MSHHSTFLATWLVGLSLLLGPATIVGQLPASDSTLAAGPDSLPVFTDSMLRIFGPQATPDTVPQVWLDSVSGADSTGVAADSLPVLPDSMQRTVGTGATPDTVPEVQLDSASRTDSTGTAPDSLLPKANAGATKSDTAAVSSEPRDSILAVACHGPTGPPTVARDLLVVVFTPEAGARERAAAAQSVGGKLIEPVSSGRPGAYYLRVPSDGQEFRLRAAADKLIQLPQVQQVGSRACPALPRDTTRQSAHAAPAPRHRGRLWLRGVDNPGPEPASRRLNRIPDTVSFTAK